MDHQSPELIERQMEETRESLTDKVALLEQQVAGKIQSATDAVQETVQTVKSAVEETVSAVSGGVKDSVATVSEGMKEALDVSGHVRRNPWAMVGGAAVAGLVTGLALFRSTRQSASAPAFVPMASGPVPQAAPTPRPAWMNDLLELAGREVKKLAERALAKAADSVQKNVEEGIPKLIDRALPEVPVHNAHHGNGHYAAMR